MVSSLAPQPVDRPAPRILVVEDELSIQRGLCDALRFRGYEVQAVADGRSALAVARTAAVDLIVLDVMLPELDGFRVCGELRATGHHAPVLMLTAKGGEDDIVRGFAAGADDYVTKPFGVRELMARVEALLRRNTHLSQTPFDAGPIQVRPDRSDAVAGTLHFELTAREVAILRSLAEDPGRIVSRLRLLREAWGMHNARDIETRTVDVHIAKLRRKLGPHGRLISTVRGQGYRLCP